MKKWWAALSTRKRAFAIAGGIGIAITFLTQIIYALHMVFTGQGLTTYHSAKQVQGSYLGLLITLGVIALALVAGLAVRFYLGWRERRIIQELREKYRGS